MCDHTFSLWVFYSQNVFETSEVRGSFVFGKASFLASFQVYTETFRRQQKVTTTENLLGAVFYTSYWKSRSYTTFLLQGGANCPLTFVPRFPNCLYLSDACSLTFSALKTNRKQFHPAQKVWMQLFRKRTSFSNEVGTFLKVPIRIKVSQKCTSIENIMQNS